MDHSYGASYWKYIYVPTTYYGCVPYPSLHSLHLHHEGGKWMTMDTVRYGIGISYHIVPQSSNLPLLSLAKFLRDLHVELITSIILPPVFGLLRADGFDVPETEETGANFVTLPVPSYYGLIAPNVG